MCQSFSLGKLTIGHHFLNYDTPTTGDISNDFRSSQINTFVSIIMPLFLQLLYASGPGYYLFTYTGNIQFPSQLNDLKQEKWIPKIIKKIIQTLLGYDNCETVKVEHE